VTARYAEAKQKESASISTRGPTGFQFFRVNVFAKTDGRGWFEQRSIDGVETSALSDQRSDLCDKPSDCGR